VHSEDSKECNFFLIRSVRTCNPSDSRIAGGTQIGTLVNPEYTG
jgi:hypothetical protein